jgi:tRNA threonylcarbamoyladenosine biosynthesis protein TsaB
MERSFYATGNDVGAAAMNLLAIDTALEACSVAVAGKGRPLLALSEVVGRGHAERLFGMIAAAMKELGLAFDDLDRIAVTVGPGSFTGLRVGIAAARGLGLAIGCPVAGIGTLEAHAASARRIAGDVPVMALLSARREEVYCQRFAADGAALGSPAVGSAESFAAQVADGEFLAGSGADTVLSASSGRLPPVVHRNAAPDIRAVAELAVAAPSPTDAPHPLYLRPPDAKPAATVGVARR